eukprot:gene8428-11402_t
MSTFDSRKDYSAELQTIISQSASIANLDDAVNVLFVFEKKCRQGNEFSSLKEVCLHMVRLCRDRSDWAKLNSVLTLINKRNAQNKLTITSVVAETLTYVDLTPNEDIKIELVKVLKEICSGKIYVEAESARLHMMLSIIYEGRGDIEAACDMIQDVHVETYGSLTKQEKAEYILEQMRLTLLKKDLVRTMIHSRKMNLKTIDEVGFEAIKTRFYSMMVEYHTAERNSWEISLAYYKIFEASNGPEKIEAAKESLESCIIFLIMSKYDNHQSDMMQRIKKRLQTSKELILHNTYLSTLTFFTTDEIIPIPFLNQSILENHSSIVLVASRNPDTKLFFINQLRDRIIQHNLRVIAKYYKRIRSARLEVLLGLSANELELQISTIASSGDLFVKIDRPAGIISFEQKKLPEYVLSEWASDLNKMLNLMEGTCHLINRENMVYKL